MVGATAIELSRATNAVRLSLSHRVPNVRVSAIHLASGWRRERGIATIDEFSADEAAAYITYLRDRGAAPATLRKVRTLLSSLAEFCAETPGYEAGLQGDAMRSLLLPVLVERIPRR